MKDVQFKMKPQFFTNIFGMDKQYKDLCIKHAGIMKVSTIRRMAQEVGIVHELRADVEVIKKGVRQVTPIDLVNVSKKEI